MSIQYHSCATSLLSGIERCQKLRKTILSINIFDYTSLRSMAQVFSSAGKPIIAQCSSRLFKQYEPGEIVAWRDTLNLGRVWLHLDHCDDPKLLKSCAKAGFDSVMFDGSGLPLPENIKLSRHALKAAKRAAPGVLVECEIGHVCGVEDGFGSEEANGEALTVADVLKFYEHVRPDLLAVGFGNMHGHYKGNEVFDLQLVKGVAEALPFVPLVLHGGSGMALPLVRKLVDWGHCKMNISTDLKHAWMEAFRDAAQAKQSSPIAVNAFVQDRMDVFFSKLHNKYKNVCCN